MVEAAGIETKAGVLPIFGKTHFTFANIGDSTVFLF